MSTCASRPSDSSVSEPHDSTALNPQLLARTLSLRDLTDPKQGEHAIQHVVTCIEGALGDRWQIPVSRDPGPRIVPVADNYDALRYTPDAASRDSRYTRYVGNGQMLRSHTSARIPALLRGLASRVPEAALGGHEVLLSVPGITYRRDVIDRQHVGEPHQLDLWRIRIEGPSLAEADLTQMIGLVVAAALPGRSWRSEPSPHPYTLAGREILVQVNDHEIEIGECGLAHPEVLEAAGLPAASAGLAMGLGLDRLLMLAKGIDDIRLLRSTDPRVNGQMQDLTQYQPVSAMPAARRDLSVAVQADLDEELLGDVIRAALGDDAAAVEEVQVLSQTGYDNLPLAARERLGMRGGQKNLLLRVLLRDLHATLTSEQANALRDRIYAALHTGDVSHWAGTNPSG